MATRRKVDDFPPRVRIDSAAGFADVVDPRDGHVLPWTAVELRCTRNSRRWAATVTLRGGKRFAAEVESISLEVIEQPSRGLLRGKGGKR